MPRAISISLPIKKRLEDQGFSGHVLSVYDEACNLVDDEKSVITLAAPSVGDGPFSIVVLAPFDSLAVGDAVRADGHHLAVGGLVISLDEASIWDPRPDWTGLREAKDIASGFAAFDEWLSSAIWGGLAHITGADQYTEGKPTFMARLGRGREAYHRLIIEGLGEKMPDSLAGGARLLAGLGPGDTPAADDFLIGVIAAIWIMGDEADATVVAEAAAGRTSSLSAAFLRAAGRGEFMAPWHILLKALADGNPTQVEKAAMAVESLGMNSGADALDGFILAGRRLLNLDDIDIEYRRDLDE